MWWILTSVMGDHTTCTFRAEVQSCFSTRHDTRLEDKGRLFLQNFCIRLQDYIVSQTGRPKSEHSFTTMKTWNPISVTFIQRQHFTLTLTMEIPWSSDTMVQPARLDGVTKQNNLKSMFSLPVIPLHCVIHEDCNTHYQSCVPIHNAMILHWTRLVLTVFQNFHIANGHHTGTLLAHI
jgi:hypothetical protein